MFTAGGLVAATCLLSGCVFVRLLELKHQLGDFDRNFSVATDDGVRIICRHPVLLTDDVRWLGLTPESERAIGHAVAWDVRLVKQLPPSIHEAGAFDIVVRLYFADDKLTRVAIPERYFTLMPKKFLLDLLRSLGGSRVDRQKRSVEAQLAGHRPDLPAIQSLLGRPTSETTTGGETISHYRYAPIGRSGVVHAAVLEMTVYFDKITGDMVRWQGHTPVGTVGFNFQPTH